MGKIGWPSFNLLLGLEVAKQYMYRVLLVLDFNLKLKEMKPDLFFHEENNLKMEGQPIGIRKKVRAEKGSNQLEPFS